MTRLPFLSSPGTFLWCLVLPAVLHSAPAPALDHAAPGEYSSAIARADSLYQRRNYESALVAYRRASELAPDELGPRLGLGWTWLQLGCYPEAESVFKEILRAPTARGQAPYTLSGQLRNATNGLRLIPPVYHLSIALGEMLGIGTGSFRSFSGFLKLSDLRQTSVTLGLQGVQNDTDQGFNTGLVVSRRLAFPWSARFDFYGLSAFNNRRYWQVVYAPTLSRVINTATVNLTLIGWDKLQVMGVQAGADVRIRPGLHVSAAPVGNRAYGRFGWLVPVELTWRPLSWLEARAGAGGGSIAYHADFAIPAFYNQPERLLGQFKLGADFTFLSRFRVRLFVAGESYSNGNRRLYPSLTVQAGL